MLMNNSLGQSRQTQSAGFVTALFTLANEQLPIWLCSERAETSLRSEKLTVGTEGPKDQD